LFNDVELQRFCLLYCFFVLLLFA